MHHHRHHQSSSLSSSHILSHRYRILSQLLTFHEFMRPLPCGLISRLFCSLLFVRCLVAFLRAHRAPSSFVGCAPQHQQTHVQTRRGQCSRSGDAPLLQSHTYRASSHARQRATRHDGRRAPASAEQQMPDGLHGSWHARLELDVRLWSYQAATPISRSRSRVTQRGQRQEKKRQSVSSCGEARASLSESSVRVPRQRNIHVHSAQCPVPSSVHWTTGEGCRTAETTQAGTLQGVAAVGALY